MPTKVYTEAPLEGTPKCSLSGWLGSPTMLFTKEMLGSVPALQDPICKKEQQEKEKAKPDSSHVGHSEQSGRIG